MSGEPEQANFVPSELRIKELEAEAAALREALWFYAQVDNYNGFCVEGDKGKTARNALSPTAGKQLLERLERTIYERDEWKRHCQNIAPNTAKKIQSELDATEALKAKEEK